MSFELDGVSVWVSVRIVLKAQGRGIGGCCLYGGGVVRDTDPSLFECLCKDLAYCAAGSVFMGETMGKKRRKNHSNCEPRTTLHAMAGYVPRFYIIPTLVFKRIFSIVSYIYLLCLVKLYAAANKQYILKVATTCYMLCICIRLEHNAGVLSMIYFRAGAFQHYKALKSRNE